MPPPICRWRSATSSAGTHRAESADRMAAARSVEGALRLFETDGDERLDGVCSPRDDRGLVLVRRKQREHEVGHVARVAAARPTDTDAQPEELRAPEPAGDRTEPVVTREAAPEPRLEAADGEVDLVMDDEQGFERRLVETRPPAAPSVPSRSCRCPASTTRAGGRRCESRRCGH